MLEERQDKETERRGAGALAGIPRREFTKRAAVAGLGLTGLSGLLAACGDGASGGASGTTASVAIPAKATGHIELLGADANAPTAAGEALKARRIAWLKANPGATVTYQPGPVDGFTAVVTTRSRAHKLADVIEMLGDRYFEAAFPALMPLSRDMFPDLKDTISLWESTTLGLDPDRLAGVPIGGSGSLWYYNKALFEQAGLDPDKTPDTWAELSDMVEQIKGAGIQPVTLSGDYIGALNLWYPHLAQFFPTTADVMAFRRGEIPLTDERFVNSLEPLVQANKDGWFPEDFLGKKASDMEADFANGRAALISGLVGGLANWPVWDRKLGKDAYGVFPAPVMPKAREKVFFWFPDFMYSINKDTQNLPAALSFVNFLASREGLTLGLKYGGAMPNRTDVDVEAVTGSKGAAAIAELVKTLPLVDVPVSFLEPAATEGMFKTTGPTIKNGDIDGFLSTLQQQNQT